MSLNPQPSTTPGTVAAHRAMQPNVGNSFLTGFDNIFKKELDDWFHTRRWLAQLLIWVGIINVFMAFVMFVVPVIEAQQGEAPSGEIQDAATLGLQLLFSFGVIAGSIGIVILAQDEIVGEKQSGTAAWILSKPLSRPSFVLSKFAANTIGSLIFITLIPGVIGYFEILLADGQPPAIGPYIAGLAVVQLNLMFYLALALMLGVFFPSRGPVIGICLAVLFGGSIFINFLPAIAYILPVALQNIAPAIAMGQPLPPFASFEMISTALLTILFLVVAVIRFQKLEL